MIFVPLLSEIVEAVKEKEGLTEVSDELNDLAGGFFNTSYAIGCLIAPILGGAFRDLVGFRKTCDIFAFSSLGYAVIFFFLSMLPYLQEQAKKKKIEKKKISPLPSRQQLINNSTLRGTEITGSNYLKSTELIISSEHL